MYGALSSTLATAVKFLHLGEVRIDNYMFRLHYVLSFVIFVGYSMIVTMKTYAGDPIDCIDNKKENWGDFMDWFCFIHGTKSLKYPRAGLDHETVGPLDCLNEDGTNKPGADCVEEHPHYLWVALMVLIQAGISYLPHYLWYSWEGSRMKQMLSNLLQKPKFFHENKDGTCRISTGSQGAAFHVCSSGNTLTEELALNYIDSIGQNSYYAFKFSVAEWLCLLVCFVQFALTNAFLNNNFMDYGSSVLNEFFTSQTGAKPMMRTLPIVTLCTLSKYGTAGHPAPTTAICVLPNNVVHQKFYLFLWFWLLFITFVTVINQVYRLALFFLPGFRSYVTMTFWTVTENENDNDTLVKNMVDKTSYSDWIVLSFFHTNLTTVNFQNFLEDLAFNYQDKDKKGK